MKMKLLATALFIAVCTCSFAQKTYRRIVSLAPSLSQSLYYLEAQDNLVGCTSYCETAKKDRKPIVASAVKPNLEKIISLKPDLVVVAGLTDPKDIETLRKFGIRVEIFPSPKSFAGICDQFICLGALVGKKEKACAIVEECKRKISDITAKIKWKGTPKVFFQIGADPLFAVIPNTFMDDYIRFLGGENIAKDLKRGTVGREFVIAKNPDYIFIATMGITGEEEKKIWSKYSNLNAAKNNRIFIVDSDVACQPTPITFVQTMKVLQQKILGK
jgi:ABC-type Fe3+-hydroxamate transport system substrate-binding protein